MNVRNTATLRKPLSGTLAVNAFLRSVYTWMVLGLGVTTLFAFALTYTPLNRLLFLPNALYAFFGICLAEVFLVIYLSGRIASLASGTATGLFLLYSALNGITLSFLLIAFQVGSVVQAFASAMGMFAFMSIYGHFTKRNLGSWVYYLQAALFGLILAVVINFFIFQSSLADLLLSFALVLVFLGMTAYDTQLLKQMGESAPQDDPEAVQRATIMGALRLYLDFINIFILMLRIIGDRR